MLPDDLHQLSAIRSPSYLHATSAGIAVHHGRQASGHPREDRTRGRNLGATTRFVPTLASLGANS